MESHDRLFIQYLLSTTHNSDIVFNKSSPTPTVVPLAWEINSKERAIRVWKGNEQRDSTD